jgi:predicted DNA binding CopG/RHH family protein
MSNNSDPLFDQYADMDFTEAQPVAEVPTLAKLQAAHGRKSRITMRVDNATLAVFKARAEMTGGNYQTLMNGNYSGTPPRTVEFKRSEAEEADLGKSE